MRPAAARLRAAARRLTVVSRPRPAEHLHACALAPCAATAAHGRLRSAVARTPDPPLAPATACGATQCCPLGGPALSAHLLWRSEPGLLLPLPRRSPDAVQVPAKRAPAPPRHPLQGWARGRPCTSAHTGAAGAKPGRPSRARACAQGRERRVPDRAAPATSALLAYRPRLARSG